MIYLNSKDEYNYVVSRGYEPLMDFQFYVNIRLRVEIQNNLFGTPEIGKKNIPLANQKFYEWVWNSKQHICEEFMVPLSGFSAKFISHIITRGSHPEMAHDPRNVNILSFKAHQMWEDSVKRKKMRIYPMNIEIMELLINDYQNLR